MHNSVFSCDASSISRPPVVKKLLMYMYCERHIQEAGILSVL